MKLKTFNIRPKLRQELEDEINIWLDTHETEIQIHNQEIHNGIFFIFYTTHNVSSVADTLTNIHTTLEQMVETLERMEQNGEPAILESSVRLFGSGEN